MTILSFSGQLYGGIGVNLVQHARKFIIVSVALAALIGLGLYLGRKQTKALIPGQDPGSVGPQKTTSAPPHIHSLRPPVAEAETSEETDEVDPPKLPREKVEEYLQRHHRNAASLLAAFHALDDTNYLNEAATNFPEDPHLQWTILAHNAFPEDRRKWLDMFKASSPSNSLATYLSAQDYFKNNQRDAAIKELLAASSQAQFSDYSRETSLDEEDLYRSAGSSPLEAFNAEMAGIGSDNLPELAKIKDIARNLQTMQQEFINSGDATSAQNLGQMGIGLADRLSSGEGGRFIINQLVGLASQAIVLQALDQNTSYDFLGGETPAQRMDEIKQQRSSIKDLLQSAEPAFPQMSESEMVSYHERFNTYGELEAMRWLKQQNFATPNTGN